MVGALLVAVVAGILAVFLIKKGKKHLPLATLASVVMATALLVAIPKLLMADTIKGTQIIFIVVLLVGTVIALSSVAVAKAHSMLLLVGVAVAMWAVFRLDPNLTTAAIHAGPNFDKVGTDLWFAIKTFVADAVG